RFRVAGCAMRLQCDTHGQKGHVPCLAQDGAFSDGRPRLLRDGARTVFDQPQAVFQLRDAELELVPFLARHETELAEGVVQGRTGALADPDCVATPPRRRLVDPRTDPFL